MVSEDVKGDACTGVRAPLASRPTLAEFAWPLVAGSFRASQRGAMDDVPEVGDEAGLSRLVRDHLAGLRRGGSVRGFGNGTCVGWTDDPGKRMLRAIDGAGLGVDVGRGSVVAVFSDCLAWVRPEKHGLVVVVPFKASSDGDEDLDAAGIAALSGDVFLPGGEADLRPSADKDGRRAFESVAKDAMRVLGWSDEGVATLVRRGDPRGRGTPGEVRMAHARRDVDAGAVDAMTAFLGEFAGTVAPASRWTFAGGSANLLSSYGVRPARILVRGPAREGSAVVEASARRAAAARLARVAGGVPGGPAALDLALAGVAAR